MIQSHDIESVGEEDSDEEDDMDLTDGNQVEEPDEHEYEDHSFLTKLLETFVEKISILKTRAGRAGLVHNFLRGLQLMTAPVLSGESVFFYRLSKVSLNYTRYRTHSQYHTHTGALANKNTSDANQSIRVSLLSHIIQLSVQYLTIIPRQRVGYEMTDSQRGA